MEALSKSIAWSYIIIHLSAINNFLILSLLLSPSQFSLSFMSPYISFPFPHYPYRSPFPPSRVSFFISQFIDPLISMFYMFSLFISRFLISLNSVFIFPSLSPPKCYPLAVPIVLGQQFDRLPMKDNWACFLGFISYHPKLMPHQCKVYLLAILAQY